MSEGEGGGEREIVRKKDRKTKREGEKEAWAERGREKDHSHLSFLFPIPASLHLYPI